jgi:hypothetical protein
VRRLCAARLVVNGTSCTETQPHACLQRFTDPARHGWAGIVSTSVTEIRSIEAHLDRIAISPAHRRMLPLLEDDPSLPITTSTLLPT